MRIPLEANSPNIVRQVAGPNNPEGGISVAGSNRRQNRENPRKTSIRLAQVTGLSRSESQAQPIAKGIVRQF